VIDVDKKVNDFIKEYEEHAEKNGFKLNPNSQIVEHLVRSLIKNEEKFGKKYCPCRKVHKDENVCPCIYHKDEIERDGHCHCFLFVSKDFSD
jgi:ferredoxin-thioredoxin reductase catalytic subunit